MNQTAKFHDKWPCRFPDLRRLCEIWVFFEPNFLYNRVENGQNTPHANGSILATVWT